MKKYFIIPIAILMAACSEDTMDNLNKNENDPHDVPARFLFTDTETASAFSVTASDFAFYASSYIEHNVGIFNQLYNAEIRNLEPYASTTYNNVWNKAYRTLLNLKIIREKCSPGGSEQGANHLLGMAQILTAYNLAILTDLMGDIPWSEALQPGVIYQPKLDKQEDIYKTIFELLDNAVTNLQKNDDPALTPVGAQDLIYGHLTADRQKELWIKTAYGLMARYTMHLSYRSPQYRNVISYAEKSFTSADEDFKFNYDGSTSINPFYAFYTNRNYFGASQSLNDKLTSMNDPRSAVFFKANPRSGKTIIFAPNGEPEQRQGYYAISGLLNPLAPTHMLSYHELQFLTAEAYARLGENTPAEAALKPGIKAAFEKVGLTSDEAEEYYTQSVQARFSAHPLKEIMMQKYLSFYEDEAVEAYNDYRRLKAMGEDLIPLANTKPFPLRFTYGNSDVVSNKNVAAAYGNGDYVKTDPVWWAGGTR